MLAQESKNMERIPTDASAATRPRSAIPEALTQLPRQLWRVILRTVMEMGFSNTIRTALVLHRLTPILATKNSSGIPVQTSRIFRPHTTAYL
jgi:hypothetical protein